MSKEIESSQYNQEKLIPGT